MINLGREPTDSPRCEDASGWELMRLFEAPDGRSTQAGSLLNLAATQHSVIEDYDDLCRVV